MIMKIPKSEVKIFFGDEEKPITAHIEARPGMVKSQQKGLERLTKIMEEVREAESYKELAKWGMLATGYANALHDIDLVSEKELLDIIEVLDRAGQKTLKRIEAVRHPFWSRIKRKMVTE